MLKRVLVAALMAVTCVTAAELPVREKVILDTDFTTTGDDGMVGIMAAQLHAQGVIELLGITVVAGNEWLPQEVADALRAVERLGIADSVGVYAGAKYPLVHDYRNLPQEKAMWGVGGSWYKRPEPASGDLIAPLDGFAATTRVQPQHAVDFIVDTVKKFPREVTLLAIGPLPTIALAIRLHPAIGP
jgi:ribosylpyrimidine nucleosidase